jgi:hypothetical protein
LSLSGVAGKFQIGGPNPMSACREVEWRSPSPQRVRDA